MCVYFFVSAPCAEKEGVMAIIASSNKSENKNTVTAYECAEAVAECIEKNGLNSMLYDAPEGTYVLITDAWSDDADIIDAALKAKGIDSYPDGFTVGPSDSLAVCEICHRPIDIVPTSAFWQPDYIVSDGEYVCRDCAEPEQVIEAAEGKAVYASQLDREKMTDAGYVPFEFGGETSFDSDCVSIETVRAEAAKTDPKPIVYVSDSTPFACDYSIYVKADR